MQHDDTGTRSSARSWGPFSGRQLATIICVLIATIAFPVSAWATVSYSGVFVTDAHTGVHASVDANGNLQTKNNGTVISSLAAATAEVNVVGSNSGGLGCEPIYVVPAGKTLIVMAVTMSVNTPATTSSTLVDLYAGSGCGVNTISQIAFDASTHGSFAEPFPAGLALATGHELSSTLAGTGASPNVIFSVNGYLVPSSQCTNACH